MRILGLDVGSTSIKAVELDSAFRRFEIHAYREEIIQPGEDPGETIQRLYLSLPKKPDRIVVGLDASQITYRNIDFPTKDKRAIQAGVSFELEDELPFPAEQTSFDYAILSQEKNKSSIHVVATIKKNIASTLTWALPIGIDPDIISADSWTYRTLIDHALSVEEQESPIIFIQIGHRSSVFHVQWRGVPIIVREMPWGGQDINTSLCRTFGIPFDEAEKAKVEGGFVLTEHQKQNATPEQFEFSDAIMDAIGDLQKDLRQIELTCKNITHRSVGAIYLSGGTSLLPGLATILEEDIHIPVFPLRSLSLISSSGVKYSDEADVKFARAAALALCAVGASKYGTINFRKDEYGKRVSGGGFTFEKARKPIIAAVIVFICFALSLIVERTTYQSQIAEVDKRLTKSIRGFFGSVSKSAMRNYLKSNKRLKKAIDAKLNKQRQANALYNPHTKTPANFLKKISRLVPKTAVVDIVKIQVGAAAKEAYQSDENGSIKMTLIAKDPGSLKKATSKIKSLIDDYQESAPKKVSFPNKKEKRLKVEISGKLKDNSYE